MAKNRELGDFLRAYRARLRPGDVGLPSENPRRPDRAARRVAGLRREEVARLAGVSVDYYARLEQGRTGQVSGSVLRAIANALCLGPTEREYFFTLAGGPDRPAPAASPITQQRVRPSLRRLLDSVTQAPAFVLGAGMQVLATNELARALFFDDGSLAAAGGNFTKWIFLTEPGRTRYVDWDDVASEATAVLRAEAGVKPEDAFLTELVGELTVKSTDFRRLWAEHKVYVCESGTKRVRHPVVGELVLDYEALPVPGSGEQKLIVYVPAEESTAADALPLLGSWYSPPVAERSRSELP
ncbi:helix-turn-helix transcriptional regulator [Amycolatopsis sp. NBC_00345]|uniref:helix-turn-helix transcriptional regulator n=1 Tax=Amycolatopsis sp. NBC_00345 TaxID=2975955 RepID=UPI002E26328A